MSAPYVSIVSASAYRLADSGRREVSSIGKIRQLGQVLDDKTWQSISNAFRRCRPFEVTARPVAQVLVRVTVAVAVPPWPGDMILGVEVTGPGVTAEMRQWFPSIEAARAAIGRWSI